MTIEKKIQQIILRECEKQITRHHLYHNRLHAEWTRNKKRIKNAPPKVVKTPEYWKHNKKFNPFYVRSNAIAIAKSIAKKISDGTYKPEPPFQKTKEKPSGGTRVLTIYQIPDAAVSRYFYDRLLSKNKHRFSSFSYAYRNDRNVHFAIQDIYVDLENNSRAFIAEYDFSDFFGSINHEYLFSQLHQNGFLVSDEEEQVIRSFVSIRDKGIPQGTSISLFLANLVCWKLDKSLEKEGLKFARYADDTVIWSQDYTAICKSSELIEKFSKEAGVKINPKKSEGISLLSRDEFPGEINPKSSFNFLGYSMSVGKNSIKEGSRQRIQQHISYLLYRNLIQPIKSKPLKGLVIPSNDRDYSLLIAMTQIRRYMYGGLSHRDIREYITGRKKWLRFKGVMSFYPLVNDESQLKNLDGWLLSTIYRAIQYRNFLFQTHKISCSHQIPFSLTKEKLLEYMANKRIMRKKLLEVPSFFLIYKALKRGLRESGIERVMHPESIKYDYEDKKNTLS